MREHTFPYVTEIRDTQKGRKVRPSLRLVVGLTIGSFLMAVITFVVFLIPGSVRESSFPLIQSGICINVIALALGVTGIILAAVAKHKSGVARLNLFFGATGCVVAFACFFLCLCFGAIIPIPELG